VDATRETVDYVAFISYSHAGSDVRWAKWLHRAVESYRIPTKLIRSGRGRRVGKLFRDEDELSASADLSSAIRSALDRSRFLIVICSPRSASSAYVSAEVQYFIESGRRDFILLLLVEGEPDESFPACLTGEGPLPNSRLLDARVPLAADVRKSTGGSSRAKKRLAKLRIIASILDCRFDDLRLRDQEGQTRVAVVASAVLLLVLGVVAALGALAHLRGIETQKLLATSYWREARAREAESDAYLYLASKAEDVAPDQEMAARIHMDSDSRYPPYELAEIIDDNKRVDYQATVGKQLGAGIGSKWNRQWCTYREIDSYIAGDSREE
jgi:hypothetical protein